MPGTCNTPFAGEITLFAGEITLFAGEITLSAGEITLGVVRACRRRRERRGN